MKKLVGLLIVLFVSLSDINAQNPQEAVFDDILGTKCELFDTAQRDTFLEKKKENPNYPLFVWTSDKKTDARYPAYRNSPKLKFMKRAPSEVICRFDQEGKLDSIYISFYNRGDDSSIAESKFDSLVDTLAQELAERTGVKAVEKRESIGNKNRIERKIYIIPEKSIVYVLASSSKGSRKDFQAEYIQLEISRFSSDDDPRKLGVSRSGDDVQSKRSLGKNVVKEDDGTVFIDNIPMVDQGSKGYCAVAVAERLLRYFGNTQVNQHIIAQMAGTTEQGTSTDGMIEAFKRIGNKTGVKVTEKYERFRNVKTLEKFLKKYNSTAKKQKERQVGLVKRGNVVYVADTISAMEPGILRTTCLADKGDYKNFVSTIKETVGKGIPLIWCVQLGIVPEKEAPQANGGHMRLIIGYNEAESSIIFSDTWGAGHEKKKMPTDDAWTITSAILQLEPRR